MIISIAAVDYKKGIGRDNAIPWKIKSDLAFFREITTSSDIGGTLQKYGINSQVVTKRKRNIVVMGSKTWESIGKRPLKKRRNIILSKKSKHIINDLEKIKRNNVFVIGGGQIYSECFKQNLVEMVILTEIFKDFHCDTFFPKIPSNFIPIGTSPVTSENSIFIRIIVYMKI